MTITEIIYLLIALALLLLTWQVRCLWKEIESIDKFITELERRIVKSEYPREAPRSARWIDGYDAQDLNDDDKLESDYLDGKE